MGPLDITNNPAVLDISNRGFLSAVEGGAVYGPVSVNPFNGADIDDLPLGRANAALGGVNLVGSFEGGEDSGSGTDTTARLNIYAYQRAQTGSFGEGIRHFMMRGDAKAMITWYVPKSGYNGDRTPNEATGWSPVWWIGAHCEANDHNGYHNHGSIEVPDSSGALQTRLEVPFVDQSTWTPGTPFGVDITNIRTNLADFSVRATHGVLRVGGGNSYNKDILLSASSDRTSTGERWKIRADNTTESGSNAGTDFYIRRHADDGSFMSTAIFIKRSNGNISLGASSALSARLSAVWSTSGHHGFYAQPGVDVGAGAAYASAMFNSSAKTVDHRVYGDAIGRFSQYADGKMEWGNGTGGRDVTLYRSAADVLMTDDKFVAGAGLNNGAASTPATASAAGVTGDIKYDSGYIYICTATNTWKRVAIATW